jgi:signal transduction histidine kinase/DNA-binding response OmpR family regulator/PAS domain-containing protein
MDNLYTDIAEKSKRYEELAYMAGFGYYELDVNTGEIAFDGDYEELIGYSASSLSGQLSALECHFVQGEFSKVMSDISSHVFRNDTLRNKLEFCVYTAKGEKKWLLTISVIAERDEKNDPTVIRGVIVDIDRLIKSKEDIQTELVNSEIARRSLDKAVKMSELVFNENPNMNIMLDENLNVLDCNPATLKLFGFENKDEMRKNLLSRIRDAVPEYTHGGRKVGNIVAETMHILESGVDEYTFDTSLIIGNTHRYYSVQLKKIKLGDTVRIIAYLLDTSDIKAVKDKLLYHDSLLQGVSDIATTLMQFDIYEEKSFAGGIRKALGIMSETVDANCISIWENYSDDFGELCATRLYGYSRDHQEDYEIGSVRFRYKDVLPEFTRESYRMLCCRPSEMNENLQKIDDLHLAKTMLMLPMTLQGKFWGFVALAHTEREYFFSESEKRILNTAAMLCSNSVIRYKLIDELRASKTLAENASHAKADFLSRMSHEIRTPMNAIMGMVMLAKKSNDVGEIHGYLNKAENASSQLLGLINNILDMSKIDANKLGVNSAPFSFDVMLDNVLNTIGVKISEKKQQFILNMQGAVKKNIISDKLRISQILMNILGNAVKFTPENGFVTLKIRQKELGEHKCILYFDIIDTGVGIKKENLGKIWSEFEQADGTIVREYGGTGLGLSITKKIIELLGGEISVRSEYEMGTTFSFYLPFIIGEDTYQTGEVNVSTLVISSNNHIREYFENILTSYKIHHKVVRDDFEALNIIYGEKFDIVFLDYDMTGKDAVTKLSEFIPPENIVVMTGLHTESVSQKYKAMGVRKFMNLPAVPSKIYEIILSGNDKFIEKNSAEKTDYKGRYKGKKIIITEDNEINSMIICDLLEETGAELYVAENGYQALSLYHVIPNEYDLVLMDIQMPVMDGLAATRKIRSLTYENSATLPIVAMTANAFNEDRDECLKAGMTDYISKPIDFNLLFELLDKYLI